jgi:hypothetical protein
VLGEDEVEPLYVRATTDIGQVDLARRDASAEHVFRLQPGTRCISRRIRRIGWKRWTAIDLPYPLLSSMRRRESRIRARTLRPRLSAALWFRSRVVK